MIQVAIYLFLFVIPYFFITFTTLDATYLAICVYTSLSGCSMMYFYEFMDIVVEGPRAYFKNPWNWIDTLTLPVYILLSTINLSIADQPGASNHDLIEARRALNTFVLL